jgi:hypothetical protein
MVKANWVVVVDSKNGKLGFGGTVQDFGGNVKAAVCHSVNIVADRVVGEALAALFMVEFCRDKGFLRSF